MNKRNDNPKAEKCPSCNKAMRKVGKHSIWRCTNPRCKVIMLDVRSE